MSAQRIIGTDGKAYPDRWFSEQDRTYLKGRVHYLKHAEGLSVREIIARLAADHEVRRSVGWVAGVLKDWRCEHCSGG